ncbi:MAG: tryptophan synthase subunit alpha [bacterium]
MKRIATVFQELKHKNESALITYITAGYPTLKMSMHYIELFANNGADMIEIGIPFSDPIADGKTIQYASNIALKNKTDINAILREISRLKVKTPLTIMSYLNPILAFGRRRFFQSISEAGVSGVIIPDLIAEESAIIKPFAKKNGVDIIQLVAPTSSNERIKLIGQNSDVFVYCVSLTGTTGIKRTLPSDLPGFIKRVRHLINKPLVVGFGISRINQVNQLSQIADGVVIGSRIIEAIKRKEDVTKLIREFKDATKKEIYKCLC